MDNAKHLNEKEVEMLKDIVLAESKYIKMLNPIESACLEKCEIHHNTTLNTVNKTCLQACARRYHLAQQFLFNRLMTQDEK